MMGRMTTRFATTLCLLALAGCGSTVPVDSGTTSTGATTGTPSGATTSPTGTGTPSGTTPTEPTGPWTEVGNGVGGHVPLADLDEVVIVHGGQGGFHVDVSGIVHNVSSVVNVRSILTVESTGQQLAGDIAPLAYLLGNYDEDTETGLFTGERALISVEIADTTEEICPFEDAIMELCVEIMDLGGDGDMGLDCVRVTAVLDPSDVPFCHGTGTTGTSP